MTVESSNYWHFVGNRLLILTKNAKKNWVGPSPPPDLEKNPKEQQLFSGTLPSVKNITFKSSYNWSKSDIRRLTAIFSHVHSHLNYYIYIHNTKLCAKHVLALIALSRGLCAFLLLNYRNAPAPPAPPSPY